MSTRSTDGQEADVIVVGTGPAGMAAVAAAAETGASVIAVEALEHIGGNAVWSTGYLAFVDSQAQRDAGIADSEEIFMADCARQVDLVKDRQGIIWDQDITRLFARRSAAVHDFLIAHGVRFSRFIPRPRQHSVDRMLAIEDTWMLKRAYEPFFQRDNVRTLYSAWAERLLMDGDRVAGLRVRIGPEKIDIAARRGVVLASGGYQSNPELRQRYQPGFLAHTPYLGIDTARGSGHIMGAAVGGDLINMTGIPTLVIVSSAFVEDAIAVNRAGQRFHDEAGPYDERVEALFRQPERWGMFVVDDGTATAKATLLGQMPEKSVSAPTLRDLAGLIGCDAEGLEQSVARWNAFLAGNADTDPDFSRVVLPAGRRPIIKPPFHTSKMVVGANFIWGGLSVTPSMQVRNVFGETINGLFAAGDTVGGFNVTSDLGGIHIAGALTFGGIAGKAAASGAGVQAATAPLDSHFVPTMLDRKIALVNLPGHN